MKSLGILDSFSQLSQMSWYMRDEHFFAHRKRNSQQSAARDKEKSKFEVISVIWQLILFLLTRRRENSFILDFCLRRFINDCFW